MRKSVFVFSPEIKKCIIGHESNGIPVYNTGIVALESTIISHGMPYPQNLQTALEVEAIIRNQGSIPATIGIIQGRVCIGMTKDQLTFFATLGTQCQKVSRRDLSSVISCGSNGATTVAATMIIAYSVGINVFVTGGIGGVHRGSETTWDVSADLVELGRTPVAVICAGAKSILDLPKTLEVLETNGVGVIGYQTQEFPAFFSRSSGGLPVSSSANNIDELARLIKIQLTFWPRYQMRSGLVVAVPIPMEQAADMKMTEAAIQQALTELADAKIEGKNITPFLLSRVAALTNGESLKANVALVKNNAKIGGLVAAKLCCLSCPSTDESLVTTNTASHCEPCVLVIGGVCVDTIATPFLDTASDLQDYSPHCNPRVTSGGFSFPGRVNVTVGGVGRAIAVSLCKLGAKVQFISATGHDCHGRYIRTEMESDGCSAQLILNVGKDRIGGYTSANSHDDAKISTASYIAVLDQTGHLVQAVADMDIFQYLTPSVLTGILKRLKTCKVMICDTNIPSESLLALVQWAGKNRVPVWLDPVSVAKSARCLDVLRLVHVLTPNESELTSLADGLHKRVLCSSLIRPSVYKTSAVSHRSAVVSLMRNVHTMGRSPCIFTSCGSRGVVLGIYQLEVAVDNALMTAKLWKNLADLADTKQNDALYWAPSNNYGKDIELEGFNVEMNISFRAGGLLLRTCLVLLLSISSFSQTAYSNVEISYAIPPLDRVKNTTGAGVTAWGCVEKCIPLPFATLLGYHVDGFSFQPIACTL